MSALVSSGTPAHLNSIPLYWNSNVTYTPGDTCSYNNKMWRCLTQTSSSPSEGSLWTSKFSSLSDNNFYACGTTPYIQTQTALNPVYNLLGSNLIITNPIPSAEVTPLSTFYFNIVGTVTTANTDTSFEPLLGFGNSVESTSARNALALATTYFFDTTWMLQILTKVGTTYTCTCSVVSTVSINNSGVSFSLATYPISNLNEYVTFTTNNGDLDYQIVANVINGSSQTSTVVRNGLTVRKIYQGV